MLSYLDGFYGVDGNHLIVDGVLHYSVHQRLHVLANSRLFCVQFVKVRLQRLRRDGLHGVTSVNRVYVVFVGVVQILVGIFFNHLRLTFSM